MHGRDDEWTDLMLAANAGDSIAYHRLLKAVTPVLRAGARLALARAGRPPHPAADTVPDLLLAVPSERRRRTARTP